MSGGGGPLMDRRRFLLASLGGAAALALGACGGGSGGGGGGRAFRLPDNATGFPSPFASNADFGYVQMSLLYDTLIWKDGGGNLLPWLAASYATSPDHLTYTFQLRPNLKWSDGRPLTADDVKFTFHYYAAQQVLSPAVLIQPPQGIKSVTATGPTTVSVTLESPYVTFPEFVAGALPIIPRHVWSSIKDPGSAQDLKVLVGSGAYHLASYNGDGGPMLYTARHGYYLGKPYIGSIQLLAIDSSEAFSALLGGKTDTANGVGLRNDTLAPFANDPRFGMVTNTGDWAQVMYWNLGKLGTPLADVRFRRAMIMAIDRQDLINRLASGRGAPGNPGFLAPGNPWYAPVHDYPFDVAGANALLDRAGYAAKGSDGVRKDAAGNRLSFALLMDNALAPMSEVLVADLKRVGVELRPKLVQIGPQLFGNKLTGQYDIAVTQFPGPGAGGPNSDPDILRLLFSSKLAASLEGATAYANSSFDTLAEQQQVTFDQAARKAIVAKMQAILAQDLPAMPLYYPQWIALWRKSALPVWYFTPGDYPTAQEDKQMFITGQTTGTRILA